MFYINNSLWKIRLVPENSLCLQRNDGSFALGCTDNYIRTIFIADNQNLWMTRNILCHELTHAFMFEKNVYMDEMSEELLCCFVERWADDILMLTYSYLYKVR